MGTFAALWFIGSLVCTIWVLMDASEKKGTNMSCLWMLMVFLFFPIGFIVYVFVRKAD